MDGERVFFVMNGQSYNSQNEIHLIEYLNMHGCATCHGVYTSDSYIQKVDFDDRKSKKLICLENSKLGTFGEKSSLVVLDRNIWAPKKVTCKEDNHKFTKDSRMSKKSYSKDSKIELDFFAQR